MKKQGGFTLIELVLVIIVLGILSATAMPRFVNLSDDAKSATYKSISSSLHSSVSLVHSKWLIDGQPINNDYQVGDIYINEYGYPRFYTEKDQECEAIFNKLLPGADVVFEKIDDNGGGVHGGHVCTYHFENNLYSIIYGEDSGKVELKVDSSVNK